MRYLIVLAIVISLILIPCSAYAWPEPKYSPRGSVIVWPIENPSRWPSYVSGRLLGSEYELTIPSQLNTIQAQRWLMASPAARPKLAEMYGVPIEVAEQYGANYIKIRQLWEDEY